MPKTSTQTTTSENRLFVDLTRAAQSAGFSARHFRRIIEEDNIRTMRVGGKFFVLGADLSSWKAARAARVS